ncbi:hypothetical protein BG004_004197 [Podila humilis]|nr:hypothetical protein BG004_004197 [Podila humilis]
MSNKSIQEINNDHFNKAAGDYDNKPNIIGMSHKAGNTVVDEFRKSTSDDRLKNAIALDFGCGTGMSGLPVARAVKHMVGVDASQGMLDRLNEKLNTHEDYVSLKDKVSTVCHLVTEASPLPEQETAKYLEGGETKGFDLVFTNYVLHHIDDVKGTIHTLATKTLKQDGWLIIVDFEAKSGNSEHGHGHKHGHEHGHHGHGHGHGQGNGQMQCPRRAKAEAEAKALGQDPKDTSSAADLDVFKNENGEKIKYVAHHHGFKREEAEKWLKEAGLVDIESSHLFEMERMYSADKKEWTNVMMIKGRRP